MNIDYTWENGRGTYYGTVTDGWGDDDTLEDIDRIKASAYDDEISISLYDNSSYDMENRFYVWGNNGADTISGSTDSGGKVRVMYFDDPGAVNIDLSQHMAVDGWGNTDYLYDIQGIGGSDYDDTIKGTDSYNVGFFGTLGNDTIEGGSGTWDWVYYGWGGRFPRCNQCSYEYRRDHPHSLHNS